MVSGAMDLTDTKRMSLGAGLSGALRWALSALWQMPLSNPGDLSALSGKKRPVVYRDVRRLEDAGLVASAVLGWSRRKQRRFWLTPEGESLMWQFGPSWNGEASRCRLLERLPMVEWFYPVAAEALGEEAVVEFRWLDGLPIDAAARTDRNWVALLWSGMWETGLALRKRFECLGAALRECSETGQQAWPGLFCVVVSDDWQRELVWRAARDFNIQDRVAVWCVRDGRRTGARGLLPSEGWVWWPLKERQLGNWPWERRLEVSPATHDASYSMYRCLELVGEWPGSWESVLWRLGDGGASRMKRALEMMVERRYVERYEEEFGRISQRYGMTQRGVNSLSRRDGVPNQMSVRRSRAVDWSAYQAMRAHEDGLIRLMGEFGAAKYPVASGWRCEEVFDRHKIVPDGQVYLKEGPLGPGWYYVEYERRVRSVRRVEQKMAAYLSPRREHWNPVLVVCWNERVERIFHQVCSGLDMLTAPISRLNSGKAVGDPIWSAYGRMVTL